MSEKPHEIIGGFIILALLAVPAAWIVGLWVRALVDAFLHGWSLL